MRRSTLNQYFHKDTINPATGAVTPRNRDRFFQEGGSFGGPVWIPHLYNGHDKTFFFVNYDRTAIPNSTLVTETVPTAAQRKGDLSNASALCSSTARPGTQRNTRRKRSISPRDNRRPHLPLIRLVLLIWPLRRFSPCSPFLTV